MKDTIENAFEERAALDFSQPDPALKDAILGAIDMLDAGEARVAEKTADGWKVNQWLKKAVLLYFGIRQSQSIDGGYTRFFDKVPLKFDGTTQEEFERAGIRVVPNAVARKGAYIGKDVVLMPSYVNIGAYVDSGTLVDTPFNARNPRHATRPGGPSRGARFITGNTRRPGLLGEPRRNEGAVRSRQGVSCASAWGVDFREAARIRARSPPRRNGSNSSSRIL